MHQFPIRTRPLSLIAAVTALLAGCAVPQKPAPKPAEPVKEVACQAPAAGDSLIGNWLSVRKQKGVVGELRTLYTLQPDGTMRYTEQLKRPKKPSQGLEEAGCWRREGQVLILQTRESNGAPVETSDPIYTNRYSIVSANGRSLSLQTDDGRITARRMSDGYRLPF